MKPFGQILAIAGLLSLLTNAFASEQPDHFEWSVIASPQAVGVPFGASITAKDSLNGIVTNFNATVALSGSAGAGQSTNTILGNLVHQTNFLGGLFQTFGFAFTPNTSIVVTHVRSYSGTKVSIWQTNGTLLASQNVTSVPGTWVETALTTPVTLNGGSTYMLGFYTGGQSYYLQSDHTNTFPNGLIMDGYYYSTIDGFPSNMVASSAIFLVDLRYTVNSSPPVMISPASAGPFTNGVWSGLVTAQEPATNLMLRADEAGGHSGLSNPFDVQPLQNDLSIAMTDSPDPVTVGANLTYLLTLTNTGPSDAMAVTITNILPPGLSFVSATGSQGSCTQFAGVVTCNLGTITGGSNANVTIVATPTTAGLLTNTATVSRTEADPNSANNSASSVTTAFMPSLSIADATVLEGNSGQTNILFAVQLSSPSPLTVTVNYATSNGTAQAGSDYVSTNGILTFAPGETNHVVTVAVIGDTNPEPTETFFVTLSAVTNAALGRAQAIGTIVDDDSITVAVFDNPLYVDTTSGGVSAESDNVQASLTNRGFGVITFTNIVSAVSSNNILLFPEFENRSLASDLTVAERGALSNFVASGGLIIVHGQGGNAGSFINSAFELAVVESSQSGGGTVYTRASAAAGTHFSDDAVSITGHSGQMTLGTSSLPASSLSIYENSGQSAVAEIPFGAGKIIYLGWDWYDAAPIGSQDGGWLNVLKSAVLEVGPSQPVPPIIITQPSDQTALLGGAAAFSVGVVGTLPLSFQWRKDGTNLAEGGRITGAGSNRLTIANVQTNDAGSYSVLITNSYGSATSSYAGLVITIGGAGATVTITPASPTSVNNCIPFGANTYNFAGFIYRNVPGFSINPGDRLRFDLGATNDQDIRRNIFMAQANTNPAAGGSSQGVFALGWTKVVADSQLPINPRGNNITGDYELTYTVEAPFSFSGGGLIIGFSGSPPSTYLDSTCEPTLVGATAADTSGNFHRRFFSHPEQDTAILDSTGSDTEAIGGVIIESLTIAPLVLTQPQNQIVLPGTNVALCVTAAGAFPLIYQWRKDGTNLVNGGRVTGANDTCLTFSSATENDSGQYSVVITNSHGSVTSSIAMLLVTSLDHFIWSQIPSPQFAGNPFAVTIQAQDATNGTVTNFVGPVFLSGSTDVLRTNTILPAPAYTGSGSGGAFTVGYSFTPATNIIVTHVRHYFGTKVSIWTDSGVLVAAQNVTSSPGTWMETALPTPVQLTAGLTYRVAAYTGTGSFFWRNDLGGAFPDGAIIQSYQITGDAFPSIADSTRWWFADLRYTVESRTSVPITPSVSGVFSNGIWSGNVTVQSPATNVLLRADIGDGHAGSSNPLDVVLRDDISINISDVPDRVSAGASLTYTLSIANTGPSAATGVMVTNVLPADATFSSASVSQGTYVESAGVVVCNLGTVPGGSNASVSIVVVPAIAGTSITNVANVSRGEAEGFLGNNSATAVTAVTTPAISIADAVVAEGDAGTTNMVFAVTLAAPSAQTISVNHTTSSGTAAAGSDYLGTNGTLTFLPGITNLSILVTILGDKIVESNETFVVNLLSPTNGVLGRSQGIGTIINDDGLPGYLDHFIWNGIPSPQAAGVSFAGTITAKDVLNNTVTNFNGTVALSGLAGGQATNTILGNLMHDSTSSGLYTLGFAFTPNSTIVVTHVRSYSGTKVSIWQTNGTLLTSQNVTSVPGSWVETALPTPVTLTAGSTYIVGFYTAGDTYYFRTDRTNSFPNGTIVNAYYYTSGDGFPSTVTASQTVFLVDLRYTVGSSLTIPVAPAVSGNFTNGIWSGNVTVQAVATNVVLLADDGGGHAGFSNPFDLVLQNDLSVTISDLPDPVSVGANLTYTVAITNTGPTDATSVVVTNFLPVDAAFVSAAVSQGTYTQSNGMLICELGTLPGATNASVSIVVVPTLSGATLTNTAIVSRAEPEAYLGNNMATALTTVTPPAISIADAEVVEGNVGTTNMVFAVTLAVTSAQTVTVNYSTGNGTAIAGSDYLATNGILTFAPGTTNQNVLVKVTGDTLIEPTENLFVNLFNVSNGVLARSQGVGTITNDDGLPGQVDHFAWVPISSPQITNFPFTATITALDPFNTLVTNFNGSAQVTASPSVPISPTVFGPFSNGVWSGSIAVQAFATNLVLRADDGDGHIGLSNPFHVITSNQPPVIIAPPQNAVAYLGGVAAFQANILGSAPLSYQWRFNGIDIPAATNSTFNLNRVTLGQAGNYSLVVWNPFGTNNTAKATLSVLQVVAWGEGTNISGVNFNYGQSIVPSGITNAIQLSGGLYHSLAAKADGKVSAWGAGATTTQSNPNYSQSVVPSLANAVAVAGGGYHSLALRGDGIVTAWGAGGINVNSAPNYGQSIVPSTASNILAIAAGDYHSVALRSDGRVLVWGYSGFLLTSVPAAATNVVAIASRGAHVLALKSDGSLVHWGSLTSLPFGVSNIVTIAAGVNHCLALKSDGTVVSWGSQTIVPAGLSNVVDIAAGSDHNLALRSDGTVVTWGSTNLYARYQIPAGLSNFTGIACGYYHSLALLGDGSPVIKWQPISRSVLLKNQASFYVLAVGPQLGYQWRLNGTNIPGATNSTFTIPAAQALDAGNYQVVLANAFGTITSAVASLTVLAPMGAAVNATNLTWSTSGNAAWFGQTFISHDGIDAAQSGHISDSQQSTLQTTVSGPGVLNFWWKVSSEQFFDYLNFFVDGVQQASVSGEVDWQFQTLAIGSGLHTLKWTYQKDSSVSAGSDAGWLDQVVYATNPPVITLQPISQTNSMGATFSLNVSASGGPPITYQWLKAGTNVNGAVSSVFNFINATRRDSAIYSVLASNPGGTSSSSNAIVLIRVPQRLNGVVQPDGTFALTSGDADGGLLSVEDLGTFESQVSSNLFDWVSLTNNVVITNGTMLLIDTDSTNYPIRFYRMLEH